MNTQEIKALRQIDCRDRLKTQYHALHTRATLTLNKAVQGAMLVAGYYTLAAAGVPLAHMPKPLVKRLPRYPSVPVGRLGRLAIDKNYRGRKLGAALLWDAVMRAVRSEVAVFALIVDAKDEQAEAFYRHHGFVTFGSLPRQLVLPLTSSFLKTSGKKGS